MFAPSQAAEAAARYTHAMAALALRDGFDRARAQRAILQLVRELASARQPPASIIESAVALLPALSEEPVSIWALSLQDWVRTTAREALAGPVPDWRHAARLER
jgi:hypothetical protein